MAKKLETWEDVDNAIRRIGEIGIEAGEIKGEADLRINDIRENAQLAIGTLQEEKQLIEGMVDEFCRARKDEFTGKRTKKLTFGQVRFKMGRRVETSNEALTVEALKTMKLMDFVKVKHEEKPDLTAMRKLDDLTLGKVGAQRVVEDHLLIKPDLTKIREVLDGDD